jgi:hypothetical protein
MRLSRLSCNCRTTSQFRRSRDLRNHGDFVGLSDGTMGLAFGRCDACSDRGDAPRVL